MRNSRARLASEPAGPPRPPLDSRSAPNDRPQTRKDFGGRHRVAADGPSRQPDDDLRGAGPRPARPLRAGQADHQRALSAVPAFPAAARAAAGCGVLGGRAALFHRRSRPRRGASRPRGNEGAAGAGEPPREPAPRSGASDVGISPGREFRPRQCAHRTHPSLLRGRHRAGPRDDVDDRRRTERPAGDALRGHSAAPAKRRSG